MRAITSTKSMASEAAEKAKRRTRELKERSRHRARGAASQAVHLYEDHLLLVGALTLGAGVAIGMMLPHTRTEDRLLGEYRDDLVDRVKVGGAEPASNGSPGAPTGGDGAGPEPTL